MKSLSAGEMNLFDVALKAFKDVTSFSLNTDLMKSLSAGEMNVFAAALKVFNVTSFSFMFSQFTAQSNYRIILDEHNELFGDNIKDADYFYPYKLISDAVSKKKITKYLVEF